MDFLISFLIGCVLVVAFCVTTGVVAFTVATVTKYGTFATQDIIDFLKVIKYRKEVLIIPSDKEND